jgi:uncharacterized protein
MILCRPPLIEIRETGTSKGLGVFAVDGFLEGDVVELCPVVVFCAPSDSLPESLQHRIFDWTALARQEADMQALALGYGSMYNGANPANMRFDPDETGKFLRFTAVRNVIAGEELTINYSGDGGPEWKDNDWFDANGIKLI